MQLIEAKKPETREFGQDITNNQNKQNLKNSNTEEFKGENGLSFKEQNKNHDIPYLDEIFSYLKNSESKYKPDKDYMYTKQDDITEKMRSILVDWLIDVHTKFKLEANTLFMTINVIDRFLSLEKIARKHLQLTGVAAMLIACKFEEIYAPEVRDFVYISDEAYSKEEIVTMEGRILCTVKWDLCYTSPWTYIQRYGYLNGINDKIMYLARYFVEESLTSYNMVTFEQDLIACAAIYLAFKFCREELSWKEKFNKVTGRTEADLRACAKSLCLCLKEAKGNGKFKAAKRKFASQRFLKVSMMPELSSG